MDMLTHDRDALVRLHWCDGVEAMSYDNVVNLFATCGCALGLEDFEDLGFTASNM